LGYEPVFDLETSRYSASGGWPSHPIYPPRTRMADPMYRARLVEFEMQGRPPAS